MKGMRKIMVEDKKYVMQNLYELEQAGYVEVIVDGIIIKGEK